MNEKLYNEIAPYYDLFKFNDYSKQVNFVLDIIKLDKTSSNKKDFKILDLACGTGEHIKILRENFYVEGLDANDGMVNLAREKNPDNRIFKGNLNNLELEKNYYDVITCFSSSIQYILSRDNLEKSLRDIYESLKDGGVFVFDLAYCREKWIEGYVGIRTIVQDNLQVAEIFKSRSKDNVSLYNPIYLISNKGEFKFLLMTTKFFFIPSKK